MPSAGIRRIWPETALLLWMAGVLTLFWVLYGPWPRPIQEQIRCLRDPLRSFLSAPTVFEPRD
jgi:hypothetical protein